MKSRAFVLATVWAVILLAPLCMAAEKKGTRPQSAGTTAIKSNNEIPKPDIKTIDVPDSIEWDFMLWTDSTGKHQVRGKVLSIDGKEVRLEKEGGAILKIAIDKFCKADQELLTAAYEAESEKQSEQTDSGKLRKDVEKAFEVPADETTLRKGAIQKTQQEAFLKSYNGKDICLRFPIKDIRPATKGPGSAVPVPGTYDLYQPREASYGLVPLGNYGPMPGGGLGRFGYVRLSASEAEWVSKGDCLTIRGKATFSFDHDPLDYNICFTSAGYRSVYVTIDEPRYAIVRVNHDSSLNDKIKARAADQKAIEAKEVNDTPPSADKKAAEKPDKPDVIPRLKDPNVRTTDEIKAFFRQGLPPPPKNAGKPRQNRIYTTGELFAKFGQPEERKKTPTIEYWSYDCADGKIRVDFLNKGYGGSSTGPGIEDELRLQIIGAGDLAQSPSRKRAP